MFVLVVLIAQLLTTVAYSATLVAELSIITSLAGVGSFFHGLTLRNWDFVFTLSYFIFEHLRAQDFEREHLP